ncbi:MAG: hypothetical protein R3C44_03900 [Chloroflexota bacterium]
MKRTTLLTSFALLLISLLILSGCRISDEDTPVVSTDTVSVDQPFVDTAAIVNEVVATVAARQATDTATEPTPTPAMADATTTTTIPLDNDLEASLIE